MEELEYKVWFSKLDISNKNKIRLLSDFKCCKNIWNIDKESFLQMGYDEKIISKIFDFSKRINLEKETSYLIKNSVKLLSKYDKAFPRRLLDISDCPSQIYVKGDLEKLYDDNIGIVGSRRASNYGKNISRMISKDFASLGINVVSGLAVGIDKFAHLGAMDVLNGRTIAVLGNGLYKECLYPKENLKIYERILEEGGTIVSEYSFFEKANSYHFPARNRIISGLSNKIIVVEAGPKSGSLITVEFALEQGKDVFAVPGNINQINSIGANKLIQDGAIPFLSVKDCLLN